MKLLLICALLAATPALATDKPPASPPPVEDRWSGADKKKHFAVSALAGVGCVEITKREWGDSFGPAVTCALLPGLIKELTDRRFSGKDMTANVAGALVGVSIGRCLVHGKGVICHVAF